MYDLIWSSQYLIRAKQKRWSLVLQIWNSKIGRLWEPLGVPERNGNQISTQVFSWPSTLLLYISSAVVKISGLRMRRLVSEKESLSNQDILSLFIKFPQWAQNAMEALPEGATMTCHGTQASPRLPEVSVAYVFFFFFQGPISVSFWYIVQKQKFISRSRKKSRLCR